MRLQPANHIKPSFLFQDASESTTHGVLVTNVVQSANLRQLPFESIFHEPTLLEFGKPSGRYKLLNEKKYACWFWDWKCSLGQNNFKIANVIQSVVFDL